MTICRSECGHRSCPLGRGSPSHNLRHARCAPPRLSSRHYRTEPAMSAARRALPAQNPHKPHLRSRTAACAGCGRAPFAKKPAFFLAAQAEPAHDPDHEAVAQGDRRKTRRSSKWEIEQSSPRRTRTWRSTSTGTTAATQSSPCSSTASSRATAPELGLLRVSARRTAPRTPRRASLPRRQRRASPRPVPRARGRGPRSSPPRTRGPTL